MVEKRVKEIFIAPDSGDKTRRVESVKAVEGKGLKGDRYFNDDGTWKNELSCEVTLIEREAIDAVKRDYGIELEKGEHRRNIVTEGVALNHLVDREFRVGEAVFKGMKLCEPCSYLEEKTEKDVKEAFRHRGGLRASINESGKINEGDYIERE